MDLDDVMRELEAKASPSVRKTLLRHGAAEPLFGVLIGNLKPLRKQLKGRQDLAMELYATKNSDAMYLAGLIADGSQMTRKQLDQWASGATWHMIAGCTVAWVAAEHPEAVSIAEKWMSSKKELVATAGWATLSSVVATVPDESLPLKVLSTHLKQVPRLLKTAANRVRYVMNNFVISAGTYVEPLADTALEVARAIGVVEVDMGDTDCRIPQAEQYILKSRRGGHAAPKRNNTRC